ncbi:DNA-binding protein [Burkholderia ubonensis]|uniref:DNA-binding protein n=1 Tax=Burkholderia ubonensis TaxID=101571 RepID=UPI0009B530B5|nr:DNA-binding protein [Burkholderia ubonensis]
MCAMAYVEFQQELTRARLTVREFARLVRMNENSVTNYAQKGTVPSHLAVIAMLMGTLAAHQIDFRELIAESAIEPKKPRGCRTIFRKGRP